MRTTVSKSQVMSQAWKLVREEKMSMGDALTQAWKECKLALVRKLLQSVFVYLTFRKTDGTLTTRKATRNITLVPDPAKPKSQGAGGAAVIPFYSETDAAWRSMRAKNLVSFKVA